MATRFPVWHDVVVFQLKLAVDGLRDAPLSPVVRRFNRWPKNSHTVVAAWMSFSAV